VPSKAEAVSPLLVKRKNRPPPVNEKPVA